MSDLAALPAHVRAYLRGFVLRGRRLAVVRGAGRAVAFFVGTLLACALADRFLHFGGRVRAAMLATAVLVAFVLLLRPLVRLLRPGVDWLAAAARIEARNPRLGERLLTVASQLLGPGEFRGSDEMLDQIAFDLDRDAAAERPAAVLPARRFLRPWLVAALLLVAAAAGTRVPELNLPQLAMRFLAPWAGYEPVTTTRVRVRPGDVDLPQGASARIEATVERLGGGPVWLFVSEGEGAPFRRVAMSGADEGPATTQSGAQPERTVALPGPATKDSSRSGNPDVLRFAYTIQSVDRDVRYYVTAGDAVTRAHAVRVLRRPAVAEFRARYVFPAYANRPAATATPADGRIEAPAGTEVELTVVATEPLSAALLGVGGEKQLMARPPGEADPRVRRARFVVTKDARLDVDLISTREQAGAGPATAEVKVIPDRPPVVRVGAGGQALRLSPRDVLPLSFEATDDFGVESVVVRVQVNAQPPQDLPIPQQTPAAPRWEDRRRREGLVEFDLASIAWTVGDVASLSIVAKDTGGKESAPALGETVTVLASPRSVGIDAHERAAEVESAAALADAAATDLEQAAAALAESDKQGGGGTPGGSAAAGRASRRLNAAGGAAAAARRALVRAAGREPGPPLSAVLMAWVDAAQHVAASAEGLFREAGGEPRPTDKPSARSRAPKNMLADAARELAERARVLHKELRVAARGERAAALLADVENLAAADRRLADKQQQPPDRLKQSAQRLKDEIAAGAKAIGLPGSNGRELRDRLKKVVDEADELAKARSKVDFVAAARNWAAQVQRNEWRPITLDERLLAAAQAEAVRPGGDARVARDYNLAGRAAAAIEAAGDRTKPIPVSPGVANPFAAAYAALAREHKLLTTPTQGPPTAEAAAAIKAGAEQARRLMAGWAGEAAELAAAAPAAAGATAGPTTHPTGHARAARAEATAHNAAAATAARDFAAAAKLDELVAAQLPPAGDPAGAAARQFMDRVRQAAAAAAGADALAATQASLADRTAAAAKAPDVEPAAAALAAEQSRLAAATGDAAAAFAPVAGGSAATSPDGNWRDRAGGSYAAAQARLAALPQQVADAADAVKARREASAKAKQAKRAKRDADAAGGEEKPAAARAAELAARDAADAASRADRKLRSIAPAAVETLLSALDPFQDDAAAARDALRDQLVPALKALADRAGESEADLAAAAGDVVKAVEASQLALSKAQADLARRDPAVAAKWYARAAADALNRRPADFAAAVRGQRAAEAALARARDESARYAAVQRMAAVRTLRPVSGAQAAAADPSNAADPSRPAPGGVQALTAWARQWRRLRARPGDDAAGSATSGDPPGYEAQIKAYFEALGKPRQ